MAGAAEVQVSLGHKDDPREPALLYDPYVRETPIALGATTTVPLVHDFWGFPQHYHEVHYPAPGAPGLAEAVRRPLCGPGIRVRDGRDQALDHGACVPLVEMFPRRTFPYARSPCLPWTRNSCWRSDAGWRRCVTRAC
jgi:4,5-DOPA dioxygenase extradiol